MESFLCIFMEKCHIMFCKTSITVFLISVFCLNLVSGQKIFSCDNKYDADFKIYVVENKYDADLLVFKVENKYDAEGNKGLWFFVENKYDADKKIFFTDNKYDADLLIFFTDNKYEAGWSIRTKMYLLF